MITAPSLLDIGRNDLPTLQTFRRIVDRVRTALDAELPAISPWAIDERPKVVASTENLWHSQITPALDAFEPAFAYLADELAKIITDPSRTVEWRKTARTVAVSSALAQLNQLGTRVVSSAEKILAAAQAGALPPRPQPADTLQEARLAGLKSDLTMLTARINPGADLTGSLLVDRLTPRLTAAVAAGDKVAAWLLASSGWITDVLAPSIGYDSTGIQAVSASWDQAVNDILAAGNPDSAAAVALFRVLDDTTNGLPPLIVVCGSFLQQITGAISDYVVDQLRIAGR